ncbi:hypothetical protein LRY65_01755 [Candidatus Woesebacteria bacterium]|nr:hypothetical protein [Candidatus Woesebacteria bacterium]MCD8507113.1 hypothetical protein [Candidatus Woesebacteria bacterium]MCD8526916.1 hypothetical protein [Candidatus Woesebacteria bacterium]MCD8546065.1 hypothetical protein [Candidatus Woesebacteria bacterium]
MPRNSFISELFFAVSALVLMIFLLNPLNILMPSQFEMMVSVGLLIVLSLFAHFFWKEHSYDERAQLHRFIVNRYSYLVGCFILTLGVIWQSFQHALDPILILALGSMILAKVIGSLIAEWKH